MTKFSFLGELSLSFL